MNVRGKLWNNRSKSTNGWKLELADRTLKNYMDFPGLENTTCEFMKPMNSSNSSLDIAEDIISEIKKNSIKIKEKESN